MPRIPKPLRAVLEEAGLPWTARDGSRHIHILIDGALVAVIPRGRFETRGRAMRNVIAQVRRAARAT